MIQTIRVSAKSEHEDNLSSALISSFKNSKIKKIRTSRVYRLEGISLEDTKLLAEQLFSEKINQVYSINTPVIEGKYLALEIAYKPGVMNPEVASIVKASADLGIALFAADSSTEYCFFGEPDQKKLKELVDGFRLYNSLVEHIVEEVPKTLKIRGLVGATKIIPIRGMNDDQLMELSSDKLFLNILEMKIIKDYFEKIGRNPTDCEVETLAQTWSEHSGHKTFKAKLIVDGKEKVPLIKRLQNEALKHKKLIVSAFVDNSGVMDFYDGFAICGKAETHNSPSAIEPYGGAMTGSGGVFRDIVGTGKGAKTLVSTDVFCLAPPNLPKSKLPSGCLPPDYMLRRVVAAVRDYGNRMGIPTNNGSFHFHDDFRAKPTVLVGAYGILPKKIAKKGTPVKGDVVVSIGGRIGRDGIHGATFSSAEMTERTIAVNAQAVQIGNAIEEKRVFDAIIEARDKNLIRAVQDSGGGGLSSAVGEIGSEIGVRVQLKNERLKYPGLAPWEIWLSESQERMILAIPAEKLTAFKKVCQKYNLEMSNLGKFTGNKKLEVYYGDARVCDLDMKFLHNGLPQRKMEAKKPTLKVEKEKEIRLKSQREYSDVLKKVLADGNICSKEPIVRLYDHTVQGTSVVQPFSGEKMDGPNDATVIRPLLGKPYGMVVSHGLNPILNNTDSYWGSIWAAVEALSNYVAVGGDYRQASLINNYVWPFPDAESLWTLDASVDAVVDIMKIFKTPVISGKDSLSSTYRGRDGAVLKIPPVLCISAFGRIKDVDKTSTSDFKKTGSVICLVGKQDLASMGGSILNQLNGLRSGQVPKSDLKNLPSVFSAIHNGIKTGKILACHDVSEGGFVTSLFEMCAAGSIGASVSIPKNVEATNFLFNETAGCFIVEIETKTVATSLFKNIPYKILGKTLTEPEISVDQNGKKILFEKIDSLKKTWQVPMKKYFK